MLRTLPKLFLFGATVAHAQGGPTPPSTNAFDPSAYINETEAQNAEKSTQLQSRAIFRINGHRFQKFMSSMGAVFLPSAGEMPEVLEEFALCPQHLKLMTEVLPMREGLTIDKDLKQLEPKIVALIQKCTEGRIKSPVQVVENPDGSISEIKAKEKDGRTANSAGQTRDGELKTNQNAVSDR